MKTHKLLVKTILRVTAIVFLHGALVGSVAAYAAETAPETKQILAQMNAERAQRGLPALKVRSDLPKVAGKHSVRMADTGDLYHNPRLGKEVKNWKKLGENVGVGFDTKGIHAAWMESKCHRDKILSKTYNRVGIGVARTAYGELYATVVFLK